MGAYEEFQATGDEDQIECSKCSKEFPESDIKAGWCETCRDNYDGPSDEELSDFYGGGGARPMSEQYREAAEIKRGLG